MIFGYSAFFLHPPEASVSGTKWHVTQRAGQGSGKHQTLHPPLCKGAGKNSYKGGFGSHALRLKANVYLKIYILDSLRYYTANNVTKLQ